MHRFPTTATWVAVPILAFASPVAAQGLVQWWPLDSAPPGTPPTIVLQTSSNPHQTVLEVTIHGFYYETITQMSQTFRRLSIDGFRDETPYRAVGRPELPAIVHSLGSLVGVQPQPEPPLVGVIDEISIPGALIYPFQISQKDHPGDPPPPFAWDQMFYQQTSTPYPAMRGQGLGNVGRFCGLDLVAAYTYPFRVIPATQTLLVTRRYTATISHGGTGTPSTLAVSRRIRRQYDGLIDNDAVVDAFRPEHLVVFQGDYLIVTDPAFEAAIEPLADQKRRRGYSVIVATTDETGTTCAAIKSYIDAWWSGGDTSRDHYVLLVGDVTDIPTCIDENGYHSDKVYACLDGESDMQPDPYPEVRLGRLSCDTAAQCCDMVEKILTYEGGYPDAGFWLDDVLLTAHDENYPSKYTANQNGVLNATYSTAPVFTALYGGEGHTDNEVIDALENGKGLLCYRGHGGPAEWWNWNLIDQKFTSLDISLVANGIMTPVVLSIACQNNNIDSLANCIGESWMETTQGAVAHYGATHDSYTDANDTLNRKLFEKIFDDDLTILGEATAAAEADMIRAFRTNGEYNTWLYLLLGDPELEVWREAPPGLFINGLPGVVPPENGSVVVQVRAPVLPKAHHGRAAPQSDAPVPYAIVSVYKAGEFVESRYADAEGYATLPILPASEGVIRVTAYTEFDSRGVGNDSITVVDPTDTGPGDEVAGLARLRLEPVWPNPCRGPAAIRYSLPQAGDVRVSIFDIRGRRVATLLRDAQGPGLHTASWDRNDARGRTAASGVYVCHVEFGGRELSRKFVVME